MRVANSTYELTADTQIRTVGGILTSCLVITDGTNDATVILYDAAAAADIAVTNKLAEFTVAGANNYGGRDWSYPVKFGAGLYMDITGTGASVIVEWCK
jgi:hypothetical protein